MSARSPEAPIDASSPLADPSMRLAARVIDGSIPLVPLYLLAPVAVLVRDPDIFFFGGIAALVLALALVPINIYWLHRYGQSVGKRILGLRIVCADGTRAALGRIFWRRMLVPGLIEAVPLAGWVFSFADAITIFTDTRQTLHDRIAGTIVIDLRRGEPLVSEAIDDVFR